VMVTIAAGAGQTGQPLCCKSWSLPSGIVAVALYYYTYSASSLKIHQEEGYAT